MLTKKFKNNNRRPNASHACLSTEIGERVVLAFTRGRCTLTAGRRRVLRFDPNYATARTHTPHLAPPPVPRARYNTCVRATVVFCRRRRRRARAGRSERRIYARGVPPPLFAQRARTTGRKRVRRW